MYPDSLLAGLRITEVSVFVAAPLCGMTLAQLGADVIRIDQIGGNIDYGRWPITKDGTSLYWSGLNKHKRSVSLNLRHPEGQALARAIITAPGEDAGFLLSNLPGSGWMEHDKLVADRADLVSIRLMGNHDGKPAVDYTVNCASGFPMATGLGGEPVNHVLPAWDIAAGLYLATGLLAAERMRKRTGKGQEITLALSDVMLASVANLGYVADVEVNGVVRQPLGNDLYGAYGRDFATSDGRRVMVAAISDRQWKAVGRATGLTDRLAMIGEIMDVDIATEAGRFAARGAISAVLEPWFACRSLAEIEAALAGSGVLWGPYQDFGQLVREDPRCSVENPMFKRVEQPGVGEVLMPSSPLHTAVDRQVPPQPAPTMGQHTDEVLAEIVGLSSGEIGRLHDAGIAGG